MLQNKKVIIFDMDGTLIDSVGIWNEVDRRLIRHIGGPDLSEQEVLEQRDTLLRLFSKAESPYLEYCNVLIEKYGSDLTGEELLHKRYKIANDYLVNVVDYKAGAEKVIAKLKHNGYTLVIATTTKKSNMDIYRTANSNIKAKAAIDEYFSKVYTREDAKEIKPNPEIYLTIMKELGASPEECLIFEDSLIGVEAANNAGIEVVAMVDRYSDHDRERINACSDVQFNDYEEVLRFIEADNNSSPRFNSSNVNVEESATLK